MFIRKQSNPSLLLIIPPKLSVGKWGSEESIRHYLILKNSGFRFFVLVIGILLFSNSPFLYAQNEKLLNFIQSLKNESVLKHAQWSVYAEYCRDGQVIVDFNGKVSLAPASGLKLFTSATALDALGEDFRFETALYYDGRILAGGTLQGNIYIRGGADPTLGSNRITSSLQLDSLLQRWQETVAAKGIKKIEGQIIADPTLVKGWPVQSKWYWEDMGNYYGAGTSGLCINENLYRLVFRPGKKEGDPVAILRTEPHIERMKFENYLLTGARGSGDQAFIFAAPGSYRAVLRGTVPMGGKEFSIKGSLPDPALITAELFLEKLQQEGITIDGTAS
ncbi:MAG TPA: D-alanyl-D-alanine carboxypeptidase/D-alanyl-D-alanine-endopeptidase, partial [Calditrichaeota bacterium]|nr:D-alanyl-D-alanine carboxypeptidase/D-alanyl-D-alanine-endopeptidase [Calditrichota bacterium]